MSLLPTPDTLERIAVARNETRRAIDTDSLALIHPLDLFTLLKNPTTMDAVIVNIDGFQYFVIDGTVFRVTTEIRNTTKLSDIMPKTSDVA